MCVWLNEWYAPKYGDNKDRPDNYAITWLQEWWTIAKWWFLPQFDRDGLFRNIGHETFGYQPVSVLTNEQMVSSQMQVGR